MTSESICRFLQRIVGSITLLSLISCSGGGAGTGSTTGGPSTPPSPYFESVVPNYGTNGYVLRKIRIGDINGDGRNDVIAVTEYQSLNQELQIYYQTSSGDLSPVQSVPITTMDNISSITGLGVGDVTGDGYPEILLGVSLDVVLSGPTAALLVYRYDSPTGQLMEIQRLFAFDPISSSSYAWDFVAIDVNEDGRKDAVGIVGNHIGVFHQNLSGSLDPGIVLNLVTVLDIGTGKNQLVPGDFNNDGLPDIAVRTGSLEITVIKQEAMLGLANTQTYSVSTVYSPSFDAMATGDMSGDGRDDIIAIDPASGTPYFNFFVQNQSGNLDKSTPPIPGGNGMCGLAITDLNGDGRSEIISNFTSVAGGPMIAVNVFERNAFGSYDTYQQYSAPTSSFGACGSIQTMAFGDVTGDGKPDVVTSWPYDGLYVFKNATP